MAMNRNKGRNGHNFIKMAHGYRESPAPNSPFDIFISRAFASSNPSVLGPMFIGVTIPLPPLRTGGV